MSTCFHNFWISRWESNTWCEAHSGWAKETKGLGHIPRFQAIPHLSGSWDENKLHPSLQGAGNRYEALEMEHRSPFETPTPKPPDLKGYPPKIYQKIPALPTSTVKRPMVWLRHRRLCGSWWSLKRRTCPAGPKAHRRWRTEGQSWELIYFFDQRRGVFCQQKRREHTKKKCKF